jgi:hypothetical protein
MMVGLPQHEIAIDKRRRAPGGIEREILRRSVLALEGIERLVFQRNA